MEQNFFKKISEKSSHEHTLDPSRFEDNIQQYISSIDSSYDEAFSEIYRKYADYYISNESLTTKFVYENFIENIFDSRLVEKKRQSFSLEELTQQLKSIVFLDEVDEIVDRQAEAKFIELSEKFSEADSLYVLNTVWCASYPYKIAHLAFLRLLSNLSYSYNTDMFLTFAINAIAHKDNEIKETGVSLFEQWSEPRHLPHLSSIDNTGIAWLDRYIEDVRVSLLG